MNVFFVIILSRIFVSFVRSDQRPCVICEYGGSDVYFDSRPLKVANVPDRCTEIVYGEYNFDQTPDGSDAIAIQALLSAGKTVFMLYNCQETKEWVKTIDDPKLLADHIAPMLAYLKENNKIGGVILGYLNAFEGKIPDYATKINTIICKIKEVGPSMKIGLLLEASDSPKYKSKTKFDLTVTNDHVDFYIINLWSIQVPCKVNLTASGGRIPIHSNDTRVISLETLGKNIDCSPIDKSKIIANTMDGASIIDSSGSVDVFSYSKYCSRTIGIKDIIWCPDSMKIIYDQVKFLKEIFKGLMITFIEADDFANICGCGKYPVVNAQIDALEGKPMKSCNTIC